MHSIIKRVFYFVGIAIVSAAMFSLVTGPAFDMAVYDTAQTNFKNSWCNTTWDNGSGYNSGTDSAWDAVKGTRSTVTFGDKVGEYATRGYWDFD